MKLIAASLILATSLSSFASEDLFRSMNVSEVSLSNSGINSKSQKSVGGVTCVKEYSYSKGTKFSCDLDLGTFDSAKVYKALNTSERSVAAPRTELRYAKVAGNLTCFKTNRIQGGDKFNCKLSTESIVDREDPRE